MKSSPQQLERIVAYLDGELSAEESAQVEQQLASDEQFRRELQSAQRAWSALDQLPMPHVGDDFANTTMEMVVDAAQHDLEAKTIALPIQRRKRNTTNILLLAMTVLLAALIVRVITQNPNRRLLADLPIIQNVDIYSQFESVKFLQDLREYLGEDLASYTLNEEQLASKLEEHQLISDSDQREEWLESLDESQKTSLRGKFNRFRELPASKQQELRTLHQEIAVADEQEQLLPTMYVYQQWLNELEPSKQYELREQPDDQQAEDAATGIKRFVDDRTFELTPEQLHELFQQVVPFMVQFKKAMGHKLGSNQQMMRPDTVRRELMPLIRKAPEEFRRLQQRINTALPPDVSDAFQLLTDEQQLDQLRAWLYQKFREEISRERRSGSRRRDAARPTEEELQSFFVEELDPAQKERLLALPTDQMQQQLIGLLQGRRARQQWKDRDGSPRWRRPEDRLGPQGGAPRLRGQPPGGERSGPPWQGDRRRGGPERILDDPPRGFDGPRGRRPGYFEEEEGPRRRRRPDGLRREGPPPDDIPPPPEE